jgi:hypothetical protein
MNTFETVDAHVNAVNLSDFEEGGAIHFTEAQVAAEPAVVLQKICTAYHLIRPVLVLITKLPLIPATWKKVVQYFVALMDKVCP